MKKQNKCMFLVKMLLAVGMSVMLTACGNSAKSESEMMEDLNNSELVTEYYIDEYGYTVTEFEVTKRNTLEETDEVYATFVMENDWKAVHGQIELLYHNYSAGGWILDEFEVAWDSVYYTPQQECEQWVISEALYGYDIYDYTVIDQEVDLQYGTEILVLDVPMEGEVLSRVGTVTAEFYFNPEFGNWDMINIYGNEDFAYVWNGWGTYANTSGAGAEYQLAHLYYFYEGADGEILCQIFSYYDGNFMSPVKVDYVWKDRDAYFDFNEFLVEMDSGVSFQLDFDCLYSGGETPWVKISNGRASAREWATVRGIHWIESETTAESQQGDPLLFDEYTISSVFENYSWQ